MTGAHLGGEVNPGLLPKHAVWPWATFLICKIVKAIASLSRPW